MAKDFYSVLGVSKKASQDEIKKAHRKLVRQYHPDTNPDDKAAEERFKEIQQAYDTLGDPEKRKAYDSGGGIFGGAGAPGGNPFGGGGGQGGRFTGDISDIFSTIFSRGGDAGPGVSRGRDLETDARISFDDAMAGTQLSGTIPKSEHCPTCSGTGAEPGSATETCPRCGGRGIDADVGQGARVAALGNDGALIHGLDLRIDVLGHFTDGPAVRSRLERPLLIGQPVDRVHEFAF